MPSRRPTRPGAAARGDSRDGRPPSRRAPVACRPRPRPPPAVDRPAARRALAAAGTRRYCRSAWCCVLTLGGGAADRRRAATAARGDRRRRSPFRREPHRRIRPSRATWRDGTSRRVDAVARARAGRTRRRHVVRVRALTSSGDFSIDDSPDTIQSSVEGRSYTAAAWVKGTQATDGKLVCIGLRERAGSAGDIVSQAYAGGTRRPAEYREVRVSLDAEASGNRMGVHVFIEPETESKATRSWPTRSRSPNGLEGPRPAAVAEPPAMKAASGSGARFRSDASA